ncbi:MAG: SCP2 sterol-binding domain-containing protein [Anaerolineales bacterium]
MPKVTNPQEVFDAMPAHFKPEEAGDLNATVQFDLSGDGGGQWHAVLADGKLAVEPGPAADPSISLLTSAANFLALVNGELKPMPAFMTGKVKVKGNVGLLMKMQSLFSMD